MASVGALCITAELLSWILTELFQTSAVSDWITKLWKSSTIIPVSKFTKPQDFRPFAFTFLVTKSLDKIFKDLTVSYTADNVDHLQFAGVEFAELLILL